MGDFIDKLIAKRAERNPNFPRMVDEAMARLDREYPPPSDSGPRMSANFEHHRHALAERARKLAGQARDQAKDLADRRKHKKPA